MMTSTFKIIVSNEFKLATRPQGIAAREMVLDVLKKYEKVELDFSGAEPTPSFADECLGVLCKAIGWDSFKQRITLSNISDDSRSLFKVVLSRRRSELTQH